MRETPLGRCAAAVHAVKGDPRPPRASRNARVGILGSSRGADTLSGPRSAAFENRTRGSVLVLVVGRGGLRGDGVGVIAGGV